MPIVVRKIHHDAARFVFDEITVVACLQNRSRLRVGFARLRACGSSDDSAAWRCERCRKRANDSGSGSGGSIANDGGSSGDAGAS